MRSALIAIAILISGCTDGQFTPTKEGAENAAAETEAKGLERIKLFRECMELAAKMPRQADDDVSDIVEACSNQAYYMTNFIRSKKEPA